MEIKIDQITTIVMMPNTLISEYLSHSMCLQIDSVFTSSGINSITHLQTIGINIISSSRPMIGINLGIRSIGLTIYAKVRVKITFTYQGVRLSHIADINTQIIFIILYVLYKGSNFPLVFFNSFLSEDCDSKLFKKPVPSHSDIRLP